MDHPTSEQLTPTDGAVFCTPTASHVHVMEGSVLERPDKDGLVPFAVGERKRLATCSGVAWLGPSLLAVVNLYGGHLRIYRFAPDATAGPAFTLLHELREGLSFPETVAASPDGTMLAIAHSLSNAHGISLHQINAADHAPLPGHKMLRSEGTFHGVAFAPDSRHLAFTEIQGRGYVEVVNPATGRATCLLANRLFPLKPKAIAFTSDARYVVVVSAMNVSPETEQDARRSVISIHRYRAQQGVMEDIPAAEYTHAGDRFSSLESCTFLPVKIGQAYSLLVVDQANDRMLAFEYDDRENRVAYCGVYSSELSFPHGIAASPDGRRVATANYGDDSLRILPLAGAWPERQPIVQTDEAAPLASAPARPRAQEAAFEPMRLQGQLPPHPGNPTVLLCGHLAEPHIFGAERSLLDLLEGFAALRWNVVATLPSARNAAYVERVKQLCHEVHVFDYRQFGHNSPSESSVARFAEIIAVHSAVFVHVNTTTLIEPLLAARRMQVRSIVHGREFVTADPYLQQSYGMQPDALLSRMAGLADGFVANSRACQQVFAGHAKTHLLYNTVDAKKFDIPNACGRTIRFGLLSSNLFKKGLPDLVEIARLSHAHGLNAEFIAFGPRNELVAQIQQAQANGLLPRNLHFPGYAESGLDAMAQINVLLCLSHVPETFGRSVAEALAARRPVIAYRLGAMPELVEDGVSGFLVPPRDIPAAFDRIARLCRNPGMVQGMGTNGRNSVSRRFSKATFAANLASLYSALAGNGNRSRA